MIGLGLETIREIAEARSEEDRDQLIARVDATHGLSRSMMWSLRHSIDIGAIFEGRELNRCAALTRVHVHDDHFDPSRTGPDWRGVVSAGRDPWSACFR